MKENLLLDLTPRETEVIRLALRQAQEAHLRNDFKVLAIEVAELRAKISDAILDMHASGKSVSVIK